MSSLIVLLTENCIVIVTSGQFSPFESDKIDFASQRRSQTKAEQDNPYAETPNVVYADFFDGSNDDDDGCCQDMTSARGVRPSSAEATVFLLGTCNPASY